MIKCTFTDKQVKTYGRCTVCTLKGSIPLYSLPCKIIDWVYEHPCVKAECATGKIEFTVSAKAVQSNDDGYDAAIGSRLAESRAKKRAYNFCRSLCRMLAEHCNDLLGSYVEAMERFETYTEKETTHQNEILAPNESH